MRRALFVALALLGATGRGREWRQRDRQHEHETSGRHPGGDMVEQQNLLP